MRLVLVLAAGLSITIASFAEKGSTVVVSAPPTEVNAVQAQPAPAIQRPASRLWNLQDADILSVINEVSQETGKNFVVDPRVSGKVTLISSKPLRQGEVYQVFLSVLGLLGYSAIPNGNVIKIVPNMESGEQAVKVATNRSPGRGEEVVVRVIRLENVSATQLIPVLRPLLPQWSNISAYTPGNVLILLGRASNLERIVTIIQDVDKAANSGIQIIPLRHASATQVATVLNNLQAASRAAGETPGVSIAVDERSNSILLGGPKAARLRIRVLISQLDAPAATPAGNTEVVYLRYLQAKTFAPLLGKIAMNILGKDGGGSQMDMSSGPSAPVSAGTSGSAPAAAAKEAPTNTTNIQAEPNTNALIITAPPALMQALKNVIAKLDIRPAQVMVEAIIAEIDESNLMSLGIQWGSVNASGDVQTVVTNTPTSFPNFGAGVVGIMPSVQIQAILSLLRNQNGVNILSTPSIMVLDNQKATIEIGQMVPTQTGQYVTPTGTGDNGSPLPFTTNDYKNVTLKLDVTPQINLGNSVRLKLNLKNDTLQNPQNPGLTPIINTSKISNAVIINSNDVLVVGGLISNSNNENVNKVPILSSVPIVGSLFVQKSTSQQKKNLVAFIKPIIIQNSDEAMALTYTKYNAIRSTQGNFRDDLAEIGDEPVPTKLPPWKNTKDLPKPFETKEQCPSDKC
ncbi:Putative type II secretion system protein D [Aquicella lusitana]|mgnify:CR=1 FL=1|uniref:General secretion pathway protein D n=2 Tax=Aquicella lusitana TaxID=254246 RepID=A0A370G165_9COXI|nr:general secretion pathway protein D [Aquicella lusitana]VVC72628.1 Putative type II secretion system protein D [Aquicella lusitana]